MSNEAIWQLAGKTTAVGMGVVFVALFLLSVYMHYFKLLTARLEGRGRKPAPVEKKKAAAAPKVEPAPVATEAAAEGGRVAAAVAVGLHLAGVRAGPGGEVAAAIATALALEHGRRGAGAGRPGLAPDRPASGWRLSGRLESMHGRVRRQDRP